MGRHGQFRACEIPRSMWGYIWRCYGPDNRGQAGTESEGHRGPGPDCCDTGTPAPGQASGNTRLPNGHNATTSTVLLSPALNAALGIDLGNAYYGIFTLLTRCRQYPLSQASHLILVNSLYNHPQRSYRSTFTKDLPPPFGSICCKYARVAPACRLSSASHRKCCGR